MKKLFLLTFLVSIMLFAALPSFKASLTAHAAQPCVESGGVCGWSPATCQANDGTNPSGYSCVGEGGGSCCMWLSSPTNTPTTPPSGGGGGSGGGGVWTGGNCYDSNNCCTNTQTVQSRTGWNDVTGGVCKNTNVQNCNEGRWVPSNIWLCPGGNNIRCCAPVFTPTPTPTATPTPAVCPNDPTPVGSIISTGVNVSASSVLNNDTANYGPANIVDGQIDPAHFWNSGQGPTGWVELNLGAPQTITGLRLYVRQNPNGLTTTQIRTGSTPNPTTVQKTINCLTSDNQILNVPFAAPLTNVVYIRITTSASPSWVAWNEISVYGSAPGSQTTSPGIIFSGDGSATFGQGAASSTNWVIGGLTYPEVFNSQREVSAGSSAADSATVKSLSSATSYQLILDRAHTAQVTITDLSTLPTCSNLSNCTLPDNLPNGVYQANGNLNLNTYAFPPNKNYVFLINGDLNILGNIIVPNGSTAFFTSSHDIVIDKNVGTATNLFPLPAGQLQGIYSADRDFRIEGINDCLTGKDKMLNVEGAIVTNALGNGGNFRSDRDLCGDNAHYPTLTIRARLDMLLSLPEFLTPRATTYREDAP